ncbi:MAG TPA: hypothetical protein PLL06_12010 [Acidobacteriota bacterium]|nr:hypothetical protein [Acidobacteriota bacterium]HNC43178.1 hypothetical protein [Acidobacteriota bacterium]
MRNAANGGIHIPLWIDGITSFHRVTQALCKVRAQISHQGKTIGMYFFINVLDILIQPDTPMEKLLSGEFFWGEL